jgi:hypothetical protein
VARTTFAPVGCQFRIDVLSPAEDRSYGRAKCDSRARRVNRSFQRRDRSPISRISDDVIEADGCLNRSGLRSSSVVLVYQTTQEVPTSDRFVTE